MSLRRSALIVGVCTMALLGCSNSDGRTATSTSPEPTTTATQQSTTATVVPTEPPGLLRPDLLPGDWTTSEASRTEPEFCGVPERSHDGAVDFEAAALLLQTSEANATAVDHEIVRYRSEAQAEAAVAAFRSLADVCAHSTRTGETGKSDLTIERAPLLGHPMTAALELLVQWDDGSGQGARLTATRYRTFVSFVSIDAVQGGIPSDDWVLTILSAVPTSPGGRP
jgi:hypothetical protein